MKKALESEILEVLLGDASLFPQIKSLVTPTFFENEALREVAGHLFRAYEENPEIGISEILARIESVEIAQRITTLAQEGGDKGNFGARLEGISVRMQRGSGGFGIMR